MRRRSHVALCDDGVHDSCGHHYDKHSLAHPAAFSSEGAGDVTMVRSTWPADYWSLTKPDVNLLIGITAAAGFCLGQPPQFMGFPFIRLIHTLAGTLLVAGGTGTLNQVIERRYDALMRRTARRPVAAGRIEPSRAFTFGLLLTTVGAIDLAVEVNALSSILALLTMASYLFVYTPLKRKTPLCTVIGALPGAAPPLIGWAAATGSLGLDAGLLYAIVFLWQFPHFMAIAWMYREDYDRAGYRVLPRGESRVLFTLCEAMVPLLLLIPVSLTPFMLGHVGLTYLAAALSLGAGFIYRADRFAVQQSNATARRLLFASIVYLPLIFALLVLDRV
jgi:heme o synthase